MTWAFPGLQGALPGRQAMRPTSRLRTALTNSHPETVTRGRPCQLWPETARARPSAGPLS
jgi:hypothetical protein